jgi:hypothetical protein
MTATKDQIFEFDNLDTLWDEVTGLSKTEYLQVRHSGCEDVQEAISRIRNDPRFGGFIASVAKAPRPGESEDPAAFLIFRKPVRRAARVRISRFESVN